MEYSQFHGYTESWKLHKLHVGPKRVSGFPWSRLDRPGLDNDNDYIYNDMIDIR